MKTKTINVYSFDELSEDAKEKAISKFEDINVSYSWWESTYEDAENVGVKITSFDTYRQSIDGNFLLSSFEVAANIIRDHGEMCETYKTAQKFLDESNTIGCKYPEMEGEEYESEMMELEDEFINSLLQDYLIMIRNEYEYQTSEEAIIETIKANEYEFDESGNII